MEASKKIRLAYVTSPRELHSEGVGRDARIVPTLEFLHSLANSHPLHSSLQIAAVFVDDDGKEYQKRRLEKENEAFVFLREFCRRHNIVFHVEGSSFWRSLPAHVDSPSGRIMNPQKQKAKMEYEERMLSFMRQNSIDIILSDSYAVLFNSIMLDPSIGYRGLILNIHPGIASEVPGIFPTRDALARAKFFSGLRQDRHEARKQLWENREKISIRRNGYDSSIKNIFQRMGIPAEFKEGEVLLQSQRNIFRSTTGATLHVVDEQIDHGPTILFSSGTPILKSDTEQELRVRNYRTKNNVVMRGLALFLRQPETIRLIEENRIRNRAFSGDSLPLLRKPPIRQEAAQPTLRRAIW
ncbi:MAG: hypothetical protein N3F07_02350 [Candidatus Micrarchaeota archaeon]|nr:hypothetical protein [Candidatus Micrarchaeota archaeon]